MNEAESEMVLPFLLFVPNGEVKGNVLGGEDCGLAPTSQRSTMTSWAEGYW